MHEVRVVHLSEQGLERNAAFHAEGSWVGWGMPPYATPSPVAIVALEPAVALELRYDVLRRWQSDLPVVQEILSDAIRAVLERSAQREDELLLLDAGERYKPFRQQRAALVPRTPLHQVASYLGIVNVALSRLRARMGLVQARQVMLPRFGASLRWRIARLPAGHGWEGVPRREESFSQGCPWPAVLA